MKIIDMYIADMKDSQLFNTYYEFLSDFEPLIYYEQLYKKHIEICEIHILNKNKLVTEQPSEKNSIIQVNQESNMIQTNKNRETGGTESNEEQKSTIIYNEVKKYLDSLIDSIASQEQEKSCDFSEQDFFENQESKDLPVSSNISVQTLDKVNIEQKTEVKPVEEIKMKPKKEEEMILVHQSKPIDPEQNCTIKPIDKDYIKRFFDLNPKIHVFEYVFRMIITGYETQEMVTAVKK